MHIHPSAFYYYTPEIVIPEKEAPITENTDKETTYLIEEVDPVDIQLFILIACISLLPTIYLLGQIMQLKFAAGYMT